MADKVDTFRALYRSVNHERSGSREELHKLEAELVKDGYRVEHGWGYYLHCPNGQVIVLDDWNEQA
jgi:hypothetical protein